MIQWAEVRRRVSLWGRVLEDEQPIAGAQVELIPKGDADAFKRLLAIRAKQHGRRWKNLRERPDRRRSAVDGLFYFLDLPEGHYQVRVVLAGDRIKTREATITQVEKSKAPQVDLHFVSEPNWSSQGCRLRLHAGHLKLSNGSPVERWPDINHKGIQASQTEPGRQPSYVSKGFNGRAAVRFDGNNHSLKLEGFESESTSHTFFFVYDHDNKDGLHSNYLCDFYADNEYLLTLDCFYTTHPHHIRWRSKDAKAWQEVAKADKGPQIVTFRFSSETEKEKEGGGGALFRNGKEIGANKLYTPTPISGKTRKFMIGAQNTGAACFLKADLAEVIYYDRGLTEAERKTIETYLGDYYGIDVDHT